MKKIISIFLVAMLLVSMTLILGSAETFDRTAGVDLDGSAYMMKGNDGHPAAGAAPQAVYINKMNKAGGLADCVILTGDVCDTVGDAGSFGWWPGVVVEYSRTSYKYEVTQVLPCDGVDKSAIEVPEDGFVLLAHKWEAALDPDNTIAAAWQTTSVSNATNIALYAVGDAVAVQGLPVASIQWDFYKTTSAPTLDGIIGASEYGDAIMEINGESQFCDYRWFEANDQYATGYFYATYDDEYIYLGWDISSENHYYPVATADSGMWAVDCVQINISTINPNTMENLDHALNWLDGAGATTYMYQIGLGVNDDGVTKQTNWINASGTWEGKATRDDDAGKTVYEVKLPIANFAIEGYELSVADNNIIGVSFTINTYDTKQRVVRLRDGGGIFGSNDWSKTPVVTLKGEYVEPVESTTESESSTIPTGDGIAVVAVIAVISLFGLAVVVKKAR
ncbi:MAG: hypothetical protein A2Y17_05345 [Clostridiales bacterium GWF2_38_85]|nr:MAG: hypothetical protein A2Y17_05345 [Clostridiales bacterium GWF2_38_85]HBL83345.1 hypothetical protein [Clostridiales bacterium]